MGVEVILAGSPQAKGRVERSFGTAQDRLIKEMRVAGIDTLGGANRFLAEWWTPFWNDRFTVNSRDPMDAHRPLPPGVDLEAECLGRARPRPRPASSPPKPRPNRPWRRGFENDVRLAVAKRKARERDETAGKDR